MDALLSVAQRFGQDRPFEDFYNESATSHYEGIITAVDSDKWTVDVRTIGLEQSLQDVRVMAPYYSFRRGHGIFQIPEIGSMCVVTRTQSDWIVVGFLPPSDMDATLGNEGDDASTGTQNLNDQFLGQVKAIQNNIASKKKQKEGPPNRHSFRAGREGDMIPGDGCIKSIAGNKIKWFTNGNLLFESSPLCQRIMSKLKNTIIDICTSYNLLTPGFQHVVETDEITQRVLSTTQVRKLSSEKKPRIQVKQGFVGSDEVYEFIVFATDGNTRNFQFTIKDSGEVVWTVGDPNTSGVKVEQKPNGQYNVKASTGVEIDAPSVIAGKGAEDFLVKFTALEAKVNSHLHNFIDANGTPKVTQQPTAPIMDSSDKTTKLKGG